MLYTIHADAEGSSTVPLSQNIGTKEALEFCLIFVKVGLKSEYDLAPKTYKAVKTKTVRQKIVE